MMCEFVFSPRFRLHFQTIIFLSLPKKGGNLQTFFKGSQMYHVYCIFLRELRQLRQKQKKVRLKSKSSKTLTWKHLTTIWLGVQNTGYPKKNSWVKIKMDKTCVLLWFLLDPWPVRHIQSTMLGWDIFGPMLSWNHWSQVGETRRYTDQDARTMPSLLVLGMLWCDRWKCFVFSTLMTFGWNLKNCLQEIPWLLRNLSIWFGLQRRFTMVRPSIDSILRFVLMVSCSLIFLARLALA